MIKFAGDDLNININEGISSGNLDSLVRMRVDKLFPNLEGSFNEMAPENSEPEYSQSGSYQPEVAYGR
tara:strand:- start:9195 stop:9398 length:204 start_codon:yes stop_codon:yes gene_type:complete